MENTVSKGNISRQFRRKNPDGSFTRGYGIWEDMADRNDWNFVCQFLPNYERRDDVMTSDDLACVIGKEKSLEWLYKNYSEWDGLSIGELEKIRAQWDYELFQEAEGYLTAAIQCGEIDVREFPVTIVSARIEADNDNDCVILQCADINSHKFGEEFSVPSRELQNVISRELPDYNPDISDEWQIQIFYESKTSGESYWCNAMNIDFE
ncbi:hypothetical protein IR083_07685 [Dysgonomonas sp. GY75]|uniref:hypothetical protein n=1 Tax=Dysgonomonas sp. GY75 TaxID=2780419 RepID=UPI0018832728|nr:hypothetical protein [Dysgonomonas sp. GY75]MBF0648698.1 hypothetical protein [Dysgonomonas sp. GY75]